MCRLFGMSSAPHRDRATFWLLDAEDGLALQSRREPDGTGLGAFDAHGLPIVSKQPVALENTHPFEQQGRLLAHNGVIGDLDRLDRVLGEHRALVHGDTDSERFFALVTTHRAARGGSRQGSRLPRRASGRLPAAPGRVRPPATHLMG